MRTPSTRRRGNTLRRLAVTALIAATGIAAVACSSSEESGPPLNEHPVVVASTDVWGSVAAAVGGEHAEVTSLFNSPGADPHEFEPSMADTAKIEDADVLVFNGGHYDAYVETAAQSSRALKIDAVSLLPGGDATHDHDGHEGHDHGSGANEHVFYDLALVGQVADKTAEALGRVAPMHAQYYRDNAAEFNTGIAGLRERLATIKKAHDGTEVGSTEPLSTYLLTEAGLVDIAPQAFAAAVENGQSPSAADVAKFTDLIEKHKIEALIYNTQAVDPATLTVLQIARRNSVPVVELTETLPRGVTSYLDWQSGQIGQLERALAA
ncbi:putative ABC transporter substrate-binding protein [Gordonia hirsuta DSM 44140 = NBRC 16056]|uniref:Putative ABC transporter substrate-binding protein n=1 Tax=Gordonia hirsuta DSM 44140 = NBRC 16056 TaxID=1121927 RepID=L7LA12_9ACTN|nr:zinc ABC transporter substrate-binding protein [Gordonia hirsuta]GAC56878.1 putative ABC transporter substrate-binding protein [Gordonia hirsuta DSM 44140 = NBRC 16056]